MIIPEHLTTFHFQRTSLGRWAYSHRADDVLRMPPTVTFAVRYWAQPKPSTEEMAGEFMTGFSNEKPLGTKVCLVRGWECQSCKTCIFTYDCYGLDHHCAGLGD
jgi:hypothetical protein